MNCYCKARSSSYSSHVIISLFFILLLFDIVETSPPPPPPPTEEEDNVHADTSSFMKPFTTSSSSLPPQQQEEEDQTERRRSTAQPPRPHPLPLRRRNPLDRPNFILFFMDDLGYGDVGFNGHPTTSTPNINELAMKGKILTTWYSACPVCSGSRASLLTGRQYPRTGVPGVLGPTVNVGLPLNEITIAEHLKKKTTRTKKKKKMKSSSSSSNSFLNSENNNKKDGKRVLMHDEKDEKEEEEGGGGGGYVTGIMGKWHLGQREVYLPLNRGFDYYLGIPYSDDMGNARRTSCPNNTKNKNKKKKNNEEEEKQEENKSEAPNTDPSKSFSKDDDNIHSSSAKIRVMRDKERGGEGWSKNEYAKFGFLHESDNDNDDDETTNDDIAGHYLPLVYQERNKPTRVIEQPLDFTTLSQKYNDFVTSFIDKHNNEPFFLYMPFSHVHTTSSTQYEEQYANCQFSNSTCRGSFGDALAESDWIIGNVMKSLRKYDIEENTLIIFTSDNGPWLDKKLSGGSMGLLTGQYSGYTNTGKGSTWEGGLREPSFVYWKDTIQPYQRSSEVVSSMDVFPTLSNLAGLPLHVNVTFDGRDMTDILLGNNGKSKHDFLFFYGYCAGGGNGKNHPGGNKNGIAAVRHGKYKAHFCTGPGIGGSPNQIIYYHDKYPLLFNIEKDPSEAYPISKGGHSLPSDPQDAKALERIMKAYAMEKATFTYGKLIPMPDGPNEGPNKYGICCDRSKGCNCNGSSGEPAADVADNYHEDNLLQQNYYGGRKYQVGRSKSQNSSGGGGGGGGGLFSMGTKEHHDRYHEILGEDPPKNPQPYVLA